MKFIYYLFLSFIIISCKTQQELKKNSTKQLPFEVQNILSGFTNLKLKKKEKPVENGNVSNFEIDSEKEINKKRFDEINKYIWKMLIQNKWSLTVSGNGVTTFKKGKNTFAFLIYPDYFKKDESLQIHINITINQTNQ